MNDVIGYLTIGSFAAGACCYYLYNQRLSYYGVLKDLKCYEVDNDLISDLSKGNNHLPYAAVTGQVYKEEADVRGHVIRNVHVNEHINEWSERSKQWTSHIRQFSSKYDIEPFSLIGKSKAISVKVSKPLESSHPITDILSVTDQKFEPVSTSVLDKFFDSLSNKYVTGYQTIERVLSAGTEITVIGEVNKKVEEISISPPLNGLRYILTQESIVKTRKREELWVKFWKFTSIVCLATGGFLVGYLVYRTFQRHREQRQYENLRNDNAIAPDDVNSCVVCLIEPRDVVIIPCGHICSCQACAERCQSCPICRTTVEQLIPMFNS